MSQSIGKVLDELQSGKITKQQAVTKLQRQRNKYVPDNTIDSEVDLDIELDVILIGHKVRSISIAQAKFKIKNLIAQAANKARLQHEKELLGLTEQTIDLLKGLTPARPEDLTQSQWYGLVEAITAATTELESGITQLTVDKESKQ